MGGFISGALFVGLPVGAGGQADPAGRGSTGDVNGDAILDVSDAVFLLRYLFDGGDAPAACADSPELVERVDQLENGFEVLVATLGEKLERIAVATEANGDVLAQIATAADSAATTLSEEIAVATPCTERPGRFVDHEDGTVTDTCTGLMWFGSTADLDGNGEITFGQDRISREWSPDTPTWSEATQYCEELDFAGHSDWRLATIEEFQSVFDSREYWRTGTHPVIDVQDDRSEGDQKYWSSTSYHHSPGEVAVWSFQVYSSSSVTRRRLHGSLAPTDGHSFVLPVRDAD